jgi:RIO-like serine/threonine protein kinase
MLDYNTKYSPIIDNQTLLQQGGLDMEGPTQLVAFRQNCVKLAWAFINIMNAIHHFGILHNDLSKNNIMLHFLLDKLDVVYIGICN